MTNPVPEPLPHDNQSGDRTAEIRTRLVAACAVGDRSWPAATYWDAERPEDADLIAHAPFDLSWLLEEVDAARERVAILRAEIRDLEGIIGIVSSHGNDDPKWAAYQDSLEVREQLRKANEFIIASELLSKDMRGEA